MADINVSNAASGPASSSRLNGINRSLLTSIACMAVGMVYVNAMFFRVPQINIICYITIAGMVAAFFITDTRRPIWQYLALPIFFMANENLALAYLIFFAFQRNRASDGPLDRDQDLAFMLLVGGAVLIFHIVTQGVEFYANLGFIGRLEIGFYHPNWAPIWGLMLTYYCKHYFSRRIYLLSYIPSLFLLVTAGSLGKVPLMMFMMVSGILYLWRRWIYLPLVGFILICSAILLSNQSLEVTFLVSGRNIIFNELIENFSLSRMILSVNESEILHAAAITSFFGDEFQTTLPYDNVVSAAVAMGPALAALLLIAAGGLRVPTTEKDFDRRMIFWLFGFGSNSLSIWTPIFLLAIKRSR